jgi:hypothetical protein
MELVALVQGRSSMSKQKKDQVKKPISIPRDDFTKKNGGGTNSTGARLQPQPVNKGTKKP